MEISTRVSLSALTTDMLDPLFWPPTRLGVESAWLAHVPFGHWLVNAHRPASIVEIGTRSGVSLAAFCEAVLRCKISTRAVAAMQCNDADANSTAIAELKKFLDRHYTSIVTVLHCASEEALEFVPDASVDLLHINIVQQRQDVAKMVLDWLPKLSARAVVLIHATILREDDRGAWRFWRDVSADYPHFEFIHGEGLGMLIVGDAVGGAVREICTLRDDDAAVIRHRFSTLGRHWVVSGQRDREADNSTDLRLQAARVHSELLAQLRADLAARDAEIAALTTENTAHATRAGSSAVEIDRLTACVEAVHGQLNEFSQELIALEHERETFLKSTSWRITAPLRRLAGGTDHAQRRRSVVEPFVEIGEKP